MSVELITLIIILSLLVLLLTGLPVAFCLFGVAVVGFIVFADSSFYPILAATFNMLTKDVFIAVPMFVFMACILQFSGIGSALYEGMYKWFAGFSGGLAMGTVAICTILAAVSGVSATGTVVTGMLAYPEMRKRGYDKHIAVGSITFGGVLGPIIPPSVVMIIVGGFANLSVGKLFIGGIVPGILMAAAAMVYIGIRCAKNPALGPAVPVEERANLHEKFTALRSTILPAALIALVLGGIYAGAFTPTEASGIGALGSIICAAIYKKLSWQSVKKAALDTFRMSAMIMWIAVGGAAFSALLGTTGVLHFISNLMSGLPIGGMGIVIVMIAIIFVLGMFMDPMGIMMITLPIFVPLAMNLGFDPLWFALCYTIVLMIGYITPPFGINLFYFKGLGFGDVSMGDIYRSVTPYVAIMVIVLVFSIIFPEMLLWLPNAMVT